MLYIEMMFPNSVSRKWEIFNYSICGPKCPIPFHISPWRPKREKKRGILFAARGGNYEGEQENRLVGDFSYLSPFCLCDTFIIGGNQMQGFLVWYLCAFFNLLIMLLLLFPSLINLIFKQKWEDQRSKRFIFSPMRKKLPYLLFSLPWQVAYIGENSPARDKDLMQE